MSPSSVAIVVGAVVAICAIAAATVAVVTGDLGGEAFTAIVSAALGGGLGAGAHAAGTASAPTVTATAGPPPTVSADPQQRVSLASLAGSFPEWVLVIGILLSLATYVRGSRSSAITHLRNERDELDKECHRLTAENAALHATRDLGSIQAAMLDAIDHHEVRAAERAQKVLDALDRHLTLTGMIADRLGENHAT